MSIRTRALRGGLAVGAAAAMMLAMAPLSANAAITPVTNPGTADASGNTTGVGPRPGQAGTAQAGQVVWTEDFSAPNTLPISLSDYVGSSGDKYTAAADWLPPTGSTVGGCNGWVLTSASTNPDPGDGSVDFGCTNGGGKDDTTGASHLGWWYLQAMADGLGTAQGLPSGNAVVSSETNAGAPQNSALQFQAPASGTSPAAQAIVGHYYVASIWVAATHCPGDPGEPAAAANKWQAPNQTLDLTVTDPSGNITTAGSYTPTAQVCSMTGVDVPGPDDGTGGDALVHSLQITTPVFQVTTAGSLGMQLTDSQSSPKGNDMAFDTPTIIDVTPQLDKAISPSTIQVGGTATLTLTVTNTKDANGNLLLGSAEPFSFADVFQTGLTADATSMQTTCDAIDATNFVYALNDGQASCTFSWTITAPAGSYTNGAANFEDAMGGDTYGVWEPGDATLTVQAAPVPPAPQVVPPTPSEYMTGGSVVPASAPLAAGLLALASIVVAGVYMRRREHA